MGFLRKLYPGAFKLEKKVTKPFVIKLVVFAIIYLVLYFANILKNATNIDCEKSNS